jgi:hypothetical protein
VNPHHCQEAIRRLFARCPELWGFSVQEKLRADLPAQAPPELFVTAIGIAPRVNAEQYGQIFEQIAQALTDLLEERPDSTEFLRGRTFARVLH